MDTKPSNGITRLLIDSDWSFIFYLVITFMIMGFFIHRWSSRGISWRDVKISEVFNIELTPSFTVNELSPLEIEIIRFDVPIESGDIFEIIEAFSNEIKPEPEEEKPVYTPPVKPQTVIEETEPVEHTDDISTNAADMVVESESKNAPTYADLVYAKIIESRFYPDVSRKRKQEGTVRVKFTIHPDGSVSDIEVVEESEHRYLNQAAVKTVEDSAPFPKPENDSENVQLIVDLSYELTVQSNEDEVPSATVSEWENSE